MLIGVSGEDREKVLAGIIALVMHANALGLVGTEIVHVNIDEDDSGLFNITFDAIEDGRVCVLPMGEA